VSVRQCNRLAHAFLLTLMGPLTSSSPTSSPSTSPLCRTSHFPASRSCHTSSRTAGIASRHDSSPRERSSVLESERATSDGQKVFGGVRLVRKSFRCSASAVCASLAMICVYHGQCSMSSSTVHHMQASLIWTKTSGKKWGTRSKDLGSAPQNLKRRSGSHVSAYWPAARASRYS